MSSPARKAEVQALRDLEQRTAARSRLRHPHDDVSYRGAGSLRVRVLRVPSLERTIAWEMREIDGALALFRSGSPEPDQYLLRDHVRFDASTETLESLLDPLRRLSIPVCPDGPPVAIADGTRLELHVALQFDRRLLAAWQEGHPPADWEPLERIVRAMLTSFATTTPTEPPID